MKTLGFTTACVIAGSLVFAQTEKPVPKDSQRLSIAGCAYDRLFIVDVNPEHEMPRTDMPPGRRLRLNGPKKLMEEIKARKGSMIEVTGLVKKSDLTEPGINIGRGIRIAPASPIGGPGVGRDPGMDHTSIDLESWRLLNASCPER